MQAITKIDSVFGILYNAPLSYFNISPNTQNGGKKIGLLTEDEIPEEVKTLINARTLFKSQKQFTEADGIRNQLKELGYEVKDFKGSVEVYGI